MGKVQVAKIGCFCWEGDEVTEWSHCASISCGQRFGFQSQGTESTAGQGRCPSPSPTDYRASTFWARDVMGRTRIHGRRVSWTHFTSLRVFKNITRAKESASNICKHCLQFTKSFQT